MHSSPTASYKQKRRLVAVHEDTALLSDGSSAQYADSANSSRQIAAGSGSKKALSPMQLLSMTVLLAGIQFVWTVELGYGTPYLLSLGLSKPLMTLVWMAGPLSGLVIQPIVGALSDRCYSKLGRRRPFIIGGAAFVVASVITIAYAKEMAEGVARIAGISVNPRPGSDYQLFVTRGSIVFAVIGFYVLDFSINTSQACARALALDIPPLHQQDLANAYAGRMLNLGSVSGYMVGFMDLRTLFPWQTDSQMQALCLIATFVFVVTITWTCVSVREKPLLSDNECAIVEEEEEEEESVDQAGGSSSRRTTVMAAAGITAGDSSDAGVVDEWKRMFTSIAQGIVRLPTPVQRVCNVQFFAWVAWFPFLFFATTWVTEVMARSGDTSDPDFVERATRAGSFALFLYSIVSLGFSVVLPVFVGDEGDQQHQQQEDPGAWGIGSLLSSLRVSLRTMWRLSLLAMCGILLLTYFVSDVRGATVLIVLMAFPWSLAMWAPFALVGEYVSIASENDGILHATDAAAETPGVEDDSEEYISAMDGKNKTTLVAQFPPSTAGKHGSGAYGADDDSLAVMASAATADSVYDDHDPDSNGSDESDEFIVGSQSTATRWMLSPASVNSEWSAPANGRHSSAIAQRAAAAAATRGDSIGSTIRGDEIPPAMPPNSNRMSPLFLRAPLRIGEDGRMERVPEQKSPVLQRQNHQHHQLPGLSPGLPEQQAPERLESGAILGIHNMYVVLPQFVINAVSSLVFAWLGSSSSGNGSGASGAAVAGKTMRSAEFMAMEVFAAMAGSSSSREAVGTVLRIGGASALVAAVLTVFLFDRQRVRAYVAARTAQ
ncbi:hypothetical protein IWW48_006029 [Coemansia sp. RSA 1200]|nr:hypothetical protein IWW48_006029 [Coemansia sp. RSA 1200]